MAVPAPTVLQRVAVVPVRGRYARHPPPGPSQQREVQLREIARQLPRAPSQQREQLRQQVADEVNQVKTMVAITPIIPGLGRPPPSARALASPRPARQLLFGGALGGGGAGSASLAPGGSGQGPVAAAAAAARVQRMTSTGSQVASAVQFAVVGTPGRAPIAQPPLLPHSSSWQPQNQFSTSTLGSPGDALSRSSQGYEIMHSAVLATGASTVDAAAPEYKVQEDGLKSILSPTSFADASTTHEVSTTGSPPTPQVQRSEHDLTVDRSSSFAGSSPWEPLLVSPAPSHKIKRRSASPWIMDTSPEEEIVPRSAREGQQLNFEARAASLDASLQARNEQQRRTIVGLEAENAELRRLLALKSDGRAQAMQASIAACGASPCPSGSSSRSPFSGNLGMSPLQRVEPPECVVVSRTQLF